MALTPGARLGPYEVLAALGAGGMGEVYRATDTRLKRQVAIKVLPSALAADTDRLARFQREAEVLASLNHPNIAQLHGLEDADGVTALVMELVEGDDLSQRLAHGALPLDEALQIARQIADALEAAHEQGIIHRDLKPANIKVRPDGTVKVLDFGLAKAMAPHASSAEVSLSPTITTPAMTQAGMILGTAAYMSPEQAKGRGVDKRSDIWGFGCVLFEMLTGARPFEGEDVSDTVAAILRAEPDWALLPAALPQSIRALLQGCLKKDRRQRIADIAVAQFLLNDNVPPETAPSLRAPIGSSSRSWKAAVAVLALTTLAAVAAATYWYRARPATEVAQFLVTPPENGAFVTAGRTGTSVAISPDGRRLAYTARDETGRVLIWIRLLSGLTAQPLPGTESAEFPFWSPDSQALAYFANGRLMKIDAGGGPPQTICNAEGARGGAWGPNGAIVFGGGTGNGLKRVSAAGGEPAVVTKASVGDHRFPSFLPSGRHVLFHLNTPGASEEAGLYVVTLDSGQVKRLAAADTGAVYASSGLVLFARQATLLAQPFDVATLSLTGEPTPIAEHVESGVFGGVLSFSVSDTGVLAYGLGTGRDAALQLTWFDRQGNVLGPVGQPGNYHGLDLSPDEKQVIVHRHDSGTGGDLWLIDLARGTMSRFTFQPAQDNSAPVWSPDGNRVVFASIRNGEFGLVAKAANGAGAELSIDLPATAVAPRSWSPDGKFLVYGANDQKTRTDVWALPSAADGKPVPLLTTPFAERGPQVSPDGKWLAYSSDETGTFEVYVRSFPGGDGKWQVSTDGGAGVRWRGDSKELFYASRLQLESLMAVDINATGSTLSVGAPRKLFELTLLNIVHPGVPGTPQFAVSRNGQRFLIPLNPRATTFSDVTSSPIAVVLNWAAAIQK